MSCQGRGSVSMVLEVEAQELRGQRLQRIGASVISLEAERCLSLHPLPRATGSSCAHRATMHYDLSLEAAGVR